MLVSALALSTRVCQHCHRCGPRDGALLGRHHVREPTVQKVEVDKKEELLQTLQTGISSNAGSDGGYAGQLAAAREASSKAGTEIEQAKLKISHLESRVKEDEPRAKKADCPGCLL